MKSADQAASARGPHALLARLTGGPRPGAQPQGEMRGAESSRVRLQTIVALRWLAIIGQLIAGLVVALGLVFVAATGAKAQAIQCPTITIIIMNLHSDSAEYETEMDVSQRWKMREARTMRTSLSSRIRRTTRSTFILPSAPSFSANDTMSKGRMDTRSMVNHPFR